jgi:hypothetical protein
MKKPVPLKEGFGGEAVLLEVESSFSFRGIKAAASRCASAI